MPLCLTASAVAAVLAVESFTLAWTHSIEKIRWEEDWRIEAGQLRIVEADAFDRIEKLLVGKVANGGPNRIAKGSVIDKAYLDSVEKYHWFDIRPADDEVANQLESIKNANDQTRHSFDLAFEEKRKKLTQGDELPAGVLKMVKV